MLKDRLIRVHVVDRNGRSIPDATVNVFVSNALVAKATAGLSSAGTVYTVQISDRKAAVSLQAEYQGEVTKKEKLAQDVDDWRFTFPNVEIPVPRDKPFWEEHVPGIIGVVFLIVTIVLAILYPDPTTFQYRVFASALAICLGGIAAEIPGFLHVKMSLGKKLGITAGGALAVFVIAYFFSPQ